MTMDLLQSFGIRVKANDDLMQFSIEAGQKYQGINYQLESDPSSASYFLAAAAITGGHICITNFNPESSIQGEAQFASVLEQMGCKIWQDQQGYHCQGPEVLKAVTVDMGDMPDVVPTLAVVAAFAEGKTVINNIAHLRIKECDRLTAVVTELSKLGVKIEEHESSMVIHGELCTSFAGGPCPTSAGGPSRPVERSYVATNVGTPGALASGSVASPQAI